VRTPHLVPEEGGGGGAREKRRIWLFLKISMEKPTGLNYPTPAEKKSPLSESARAKEGGSSGRRNTPHFIRAWPPSGEKYVVVGSHRDSGEYKNFTRSLEMRRKQENQRRPSLSFLERRNYSEERGRDELCEKKKKTTTI